MHPTKTVINSQATVAQQRPRATSTNKLKQIMQRQKVNLAPLTNLLTRLLRLLKLFLRKPYMRKYNI